MAYRVGMKYFTIFLVLLSVFNVTVLTVVERVPVEIVYDTETGQYYAIFENESSTCDEFPLEYDPKTETFFDNPRYTGGCKNFKLTVSQDSIRTEHHITHKKDSVRLGIP